MSFTLFVILPNKDVCSLRNLASGTPIRAVRKTLELTAGLPAQTYRLTCSEGLVLHEDHVLRMDVNVWDGYVIRAVFLDSWQELYDHIVANDVEHVIKYGAVHMRGDVVWMDAEEKEQARVVMKERGVVALFVASFLGMQEMCRALLSVGVNPNGRTLFGRTPLSAAMVRDHDLVMELLLSHNASLETRDTDGVTAVDVGRRAAAKQCMRKVRHLYLQSKGESTTTTTTTTSTEVVRRRGARVIRLPASHSVQKESSFPLGAKQGLPHEDTPDRSVALTSGDETHPGKGGEQREGKSPQAYSHHLPFKHTRAPAPRPLFRQDKDSEVYTWDSNLPQAARTPSAAQVRLSLVSNSEGQITSRRGSQASKGGAGTGWSDNKSVSSSSAARMLPFRPPVQELSIKGPGSVLTTTSISSSTTTPTLSSVTLCSLQPEDRAVKQRKPSALLRFLALSPHSHIPSSSSSSNHRSQRPHVPAREPSGRPPTRVDASQMTSEGQDQHQGTESVMGSQEALSVGSAPELTSAAATGENARAAGGTAEADHGDSDDDGGRVVTSRGTGSRFSNRYRARMLISRQKQQESWKTMKRRIRLAEEQKRSSALKPQHAPKPTTDTKESFEQWLERKRREQHSTDEDTSEDDEDVVYRSSEHSQVLNGWLKDLKQQRSARPHTSSPLSMSRQKSRPQKNGIDQGGGGGGHVGAESVMDRQKEGSEGSHTTAYQQWQHRKKRSPTGPQGTLQGMEEAKMQLEEKRKSLLAMALTFQDWTQHAEQRKKLMQAILRADMDKLAAIEQYLSPAQATPRQISFNEWRDKVDKKEAEIRHQRQRMRKEAELRQRNGVVGDEFMRNNSANTQEMWTQQRKETPGKERNKARRSVDGSDGESVKLSEEEKENAVEEWLKQKRKTEVAQLNQHLRQERRLLLSVRQKKPPTVTQC